jgi:hypothetical protein
MKQMKIKESELKGIISEEIKNAIQEGLFSKKPILPGAEANLRQIAINVRHSSDEIIKTIEEFGTISKRHGLPFINMHAISIINNMKKFEDYCKRLP